VTSRHDQLAAAIRELTELLVTTDVPDDAAAGALDAVREVADRLRTTGSPRTLSFRDGDVETYRRLNPVSGTLNPVAPPLRFERVGDGTIEAAVTFGIAYQGPPGYVHGALIAGVFDDVLGAANVAGGSPGMTVKLEVRFRRPTPLHAPLRVVARHTGREGRRIFATATMLAGDRVTAEADGMFAEITPRRARELFSAVLEEDRRG
jgi:acyl-coenzyme A thioesterase PaaI-like protein